MSSIINLGKYLFALPMLVFGVFHFMNAEAMSAMTPGGSTILVYISGAALIAAAISIFIGKLDKLASLLLALLLLIIIFTIHVPGMMNAADDAAQQMSMSMLLKDLALTGGALLAAKTAKDNAVVG